MKVPCDHRFRRVLVWDRVSGGFTRRAVVCHWCHEEAEVPT